MSENKETTYSNILKQLNNLWKGYQGKRINSFLIILLFLGILLMFAGSIFNSSSQKLPFDNSQVEKLSDFSPELAQENYENELTGKLTNILEQIDGITNVRVLITFDKSEEAVFAQVAEEIRKETTERDREGGSRDILETNRKEEYVLLQEGGGVNKALLLVEKKPRVQGLLIVAKGAENVNLRLEVLRAIQSLTGLPAHRVSVLPWGGSGEK